MRPDNVEELRLRADRHGDAFERGLRETQRAGP
jgi:plasmid stability protein